MDELKANCLALAQEALKPPQVFDPKSVVVTRKLEDVLQSVEALPLDEWSPRVADFVFFPLRSLLQHDSLGDRQTELLFDCLTVLCKTAWRRGESLQLDRAQQLLAVTTYLLSPEPGTEKASPVFLAKPRSFHTAAFHLITAIFLSADGSDIQEPLSRSPIIVQIISLALDAIQYDDDDLGAQLASIACLDTVVVRTVRKPEHRALVIPKAVSRLTRLLNPANKRHSKGKIAALDCLDRLIVATVGDSTFDAGKQDKVRTAEWLKTTLDNLSQTFLIIERLQKSMLEVTAAKTTLLVSIYHFARDLLIHMEKTLGDRNDVSEILVNIVLLTKSQDISSELAQEADGFLRMNGSVLLDKVESRVTNQLAELPSALTSVNESSTLFRLKALENAIQLTESLENVDTIVDAFESALPLKIRKQAPALTSIRNIATYKPESSHAVFSLDLNDIGLDIPLSTATQASVASLLMTVGSKIPDSDATEVMGILANRLRSLHMRSPKSLDATGLLWIASNIMRGLPRHADLYDMVTYCFETIDSALNLEELTAVSAPSHTALSCYVIGEAALLQQESFSEYLVDMVYPLFALVGHPSSQSIRDQASLAISKIAYACGFDSPQELAIANKDYLVDGWSMQLNTLNMTPGTFDSLASLIFISGDSIIPYLDDVFASLFVLMDHYHGYSKLVKGVLTVFGALVMVIGKASHIKATVTSPSHHIEIESFDDLITQLKRKPQVDPALLEEKIDLESFGKKLDDPQDPEHENADGLSPEGESDNEDIQDVPEQATEVWDYPLPKSTYMTLTRISEYCDRLMTHELPDIRMATLILITQLMPFLAINKERFLPLVHKIWPEIMTRVFDKEVYVVEQSFTCLGGLAIYAQDFLATRVDSIWPRILTKYSHLLARKWPQFAPEQRVTQALAEFLAVIVEQISDLSLATIEAGIVAFRPALLRGEYPKLHAKLVNVKPSIADLVWLVLLQSPANPVDSQMMFDDNQKSILHTITPVYNI